MEAFISSDASFSPMNNIASYGIIVECGDLISKKQGVFKGSVNDSSEAEIKAIGNAVFVLLKSNISCDKLTIYTDSKTAILHLSREFKMHRKNKDHKTKSKYKDINKICRLLMLARIINGVKDVKFIHVKAHSYISSRNHKNNDLCDKMAKEELRAAVSEIIKTQSNEEKRF